MFYEELDALFALVIGMFVGVVAAVVLCIIIIFIPETGMTARSLAWLLLAAVAISFVPGFFLFWMAGHHRFAGQSVEGACDCAMAAAKGSATVTEMAGAKDRGMKSDERCG